MDERHTGTAEESAAAPTARVHGRPAPVSLQPGVVACLFCGHVRFRRSRVRGADIRELLLMRLPVRCTRCGQRQYTSFGVAGLAAPAKPHGPRLAQGRETWRAWTESGLEKHSVSRPMSTVAEPRARNIEPPPKEPKRRKHGDDEGGIW